MPHRPHAQQPDPGPRLRPREDPFHQAPEGLDELAPGALVRSRSVALAYLGAVRQERMTAWQLAYRSTDLHGRPELAVTTLVLPHLPPGGAPRGLVAYQCAIDAVSDLCFPSYALRAGKLPLGALPPLELSFIGDLLERGFAVSIADHEGLLGVFGAPREPGRRVLDGVRASLAFEPAGLVADSRVGLFGYSGGGMASAWAAQEAPTYAPEIDLVGGVLGSPVGDPGEAFVKLNATFFAGLPAMVVAGLAEVYPGLGQVIDETTSERGQRRLERLRRLTTTAAVVRHRHQDFDDFVDVPLADVLARPEVIEVFDDLRLGHQVPQCPLLVVQAIRDLVIDARDVDALVEKYVAGGATVRYVRDHASEHIGLMVLAQPMMLAWMEARFEGLPAPSGQVSSALVLDPRSWGGYAALLGTTLRLLLGRGGAARRQAPARSADSPAPATAGAA